MKQAGRERIVVVEDHPDIVEIITFNLNKVGYECTWACDGPAGVAMVRETKPDLVLLDIMLPKMDGFEVCRILRANDNTQSIPIIILTAKGSEEDIVRGLELGADDYLTKPFHQRELLARIRAVLRRSGKDSSLNLKQIQYSGLRIDRERYQAFVDGEEIVMTRTEFDILYQLASRPGKVFTRDQLIEKVKGSGIVVLDRNIDVHIAALRKKLTSHKDLIQTVRGVGYRFKETVEQDF